MDQIYKKDGNWGVLDLADVRALTKHLVSSGRSDADTLLISGGSAVVFTFCRREGFDTVGDSVP